MAVRKGKFTLPNLIGAIILVTLFGVTFPAMSEALGAAWNSANLLTKAALSIVIPGILFAIVGYILTSAAPPEPEPRRRVRDVREPRGRGGRR